MSFIYLSGSVVLNASFFELMFHKISLYESHIEDILLEIPQVKEAQEEGNHSGTFMSFSNQVLTASLRSPIIHESAESDIEFLPSFNISQIQSLLHNAGQNNTVPNAKKNLLNQLQVCSVQNI
jgi:hypothetical protein